VIDENDRPSGNLIRFRRRSQRIGFRGGLPDQKAANVRVVARRSLHGNICLVLGVIACGLTGCVEVHVNLPPGAIGNIGKYNYSPSVIATGNMRQVWWCSRGTDPNDNSIDSDAIYYATVDESNLTSSRPKLVLAETPGTWDSAYTCNPKVIGGIFENPLGDGNTYTYAMYYVGTSTVLGIYNSIGVAFSNDGIHWVKYPQPVIQSADPNYWYGAGQPAVYNTDHKAAITVFYEDTNPFLRHVEATSKDGVHFTIQGNLTANGLDLDDPNAIWGDMSYDAQKDEWYALFNRPVRSPQTTGGVVERGQYGIELYKISTDALLTGSSPWRQLAIMDTNSTGFELNFIPGFVRDKWGNLNLPPYPTLQMYTSVSYPAPAWEATPAEAAETAGPNYWILVPMSWDPAGSTSVPLIRYSNGIVHEVTTGWLSPQGGFKLEQTLGHLRMNPEDGAATPFYACKAGNQDYFVSLDVNCEGKRSLGKEGYGYSEQVSGPNLVPLYRCSTALDHFVSTDPKCENGKTDMFLGYAMP
jgi:hypothetical protein